MATKKPTTQAKTKTTKKTTEAKIVPKKTVSNKVIAKSVKTNTTTKKVVVPAAVKRNKVVRSTFERLRGLHLISAGVFALLALLAGYFIKDTYFNLWLSHLTRDDLASRTTTVLVPAVHSVYDINLRWIVVALMVLSAILPLLWTLRWKRQYKVNIDTQVMPQRWADLAITSAIMVETIAILSGTHDIMTLKLIGGLMAVTCLLGWLADKQNRLAVKTDWSAYALGLVTGSLPWLLIAVSAFATFFYGIVRSPWYVYALYATTLFGFVALAFNQRKHYRRANMWKYEVVERNYVLINLLTKAAFALILIAGLHR